MYLVHRLTEPFIRLAGEIPRWGGLVGIAYYFKETAEVLAGKETVANFAVSVLLNPRTTCIVAGVLGFAALILAYFIAALAKRKLEHVSKYKKRHQIARDPKRSSSQLTTRGETRREDR